MLYMPCALQSLSRCSLLLGHSAYSHLVDTEHGDSNPTQYYTHKASVDQLVIGTSQIYKLVASFYL